MKNIFHLSTISICLSFIATNACSMDILTDELAGSPPKPTVTLRQPPPLKKPPPPTQPPPSTQSALLVEERKSDLSITSEGTTIEDRGSFASVEDRDSLSSNTITRPSFLDAIKARPQLKGTVVNKAIAVNTETAQKGNLLLAITQRLTFLRKAPTANSASNTGENAQKATLYGQSGLRKTSASPTASTPNSNVALNASSTGARNTDESPKGMDKGITTSQKLPGIAVTNYGNTRITKNVKK
jgi:hypothetical protein